MELGDSSAETHAVLSLIAHSFGLDSWPQPGDRDLPVMEAEAAAELVAGGDSFTAPARLDLLAHLSRREMPKPVLSPLAASLVRTPLIGARFDVVALLLERVSASRPGEDPLGRDESEPTMAGDPLEGFLIDDVVLTRLRVEEPPCEERSKVIDGHLALSITTKLESPHPLAALRPLADPREWPRCPVQSDFFKSMDVVTPPQPLKPPDVGWSARLREVVDFGFGVGLDDSGASLMTTDLDFCFIEDESSVTCTYDLAKSVDGKIVVDRGQIMVEDLRRVRRISTLKEVAFATRPHPGDVCRPWSRAHAAVASSCLSRPPSDPRSSQ